MSTRTMRGNPRVLGLEEEKLLSESIYDFKKWLCGMKMLSPEAIGTDTIIRFPRPSPRDSFMDVTEKEVRFNTQIINKCSFSYYKLVALHECFHLFVQSLPNKSDAKRVKDDFGDRVMNIMDIEADYWAAMYLKEIEHVTLVDILSRYYEGSGVFGDPNIRLPKLERFIGSVLSVANAYFRNMSGRQTNKENDLYIPTIGNILTEETLHILIRRNNYFCLGSLEMGYHAFQTFQLCYTGKAGSVKEYVKALIDLSGTALGVEIPVSIHTQINRLVSKPVQSQLRFVPASTLAGRTS